MPTLIVLMAVLTALGVWWWRLHGTASAARDILDTAERARGAWRRQRFRTKAEGSPLTAVDDPVIATTAMLIAIAAADGLLSREAEEQVMADLAGTMQARDAKEIFIHAKWIADQQADPNNLSRAFARLWMERLLPSEREDVAEMAARVAAIDGPPGALKKDALARLKERLQLPRPPG